MDKRGTQEEVPKIGGLVRPLPLGGWPAGLIQAGHEIMVEIVELRIGVVDRRLVLLP